LQLAVHRQEEAATSVRRACRLWKDSIVPYEEARSRLLLGVAYRTLGSNDLGDLELETACAAFERLGAVLDRDRAKALIERRDANAARS
jgi:hypothetical protein